MHKLPRKIIVRELVLKATESATLAVELYNKPNVEFRTGSYCTLMIIAWTSIMHAVFERDDVKYWYKEKNGRYKKRDGDRIAWELKTCINKYLKDDLNSGVVKNLQLFIKLRNKIEHRNMRAIDSHLMAEAQALLLNFKDFLKKEFDIEFLSDMGLYIPISIFNTKRTLPQTADEKSTLNFIDNYRSSLDNTIWEDTKYAFRAFLVPQIGNHENSSDVTIEFINPYNLEEKEKKSLKRISALVKHKQIPFDADLMKPHAVIEAVQASYPGFNQYNFVNSWKKLGIRPPSDSPKPGETVEQYCYYDPIDKDYRYEPSYVELICKLMSEGEKFIDTTPMDIP